ncbi:MAG: threonine--tRNA ligase [Methanobacteriota archaeon]
MKVLYIHADHMEYEVKKETKLAEKLAEGHPKGHRMEDVLVVFTSVEKADEAAQDAIVENACKDIADVCQKINTKRVMLYPYAHLSPTLASKEPAIEILKKLEARLKGEGLEIHRSPFGWYKAFDLKCKGHPLSELSREIKAEGGEKEVVSKAVEAEKKNVSTWSILDASGNLHQLKLDDNTVKGFDFGANKGLRAFCQYEMAKSRASGKEPPHVDLMKRLELVDYEPGSDPGNLRYYPKGRLMKSLLEQYVTQRVKETGGMEIETPIMYDFEHPSLKSYMHRFPARQYTIQTPDKRVFLRFAACFGQFLMMHDAQLSYRSLPARVYELTRYSFRVEQRGELAGLRRLRAFTMPDCHSFCADIEMAKSELVSRFDLSKDILTGCGLDVPEDLEFAMRVTRKFYEENKEFMVGLVKRWGKPALVEMWEDQFFYFIFKYEWNFVDTLEKASALNTDQIDTENAERYGITYVGADGQKHFPYILHQSPSGAIERVIYAMLEKAHMKGQKGEKPSFPMWLAPTQVRLIPVSGQFTQDCVEIAQKLGCRADVDDREDTVGKKIREAEREWVPIIIVFGDKEKASGTLNARLRDGSGKEFTVDSLADHIKELTKGYPYSGLALPMLLGKRFAFR